MNENCMHEKKLYKILCYLLFDSELCLLICCLKCESYVLDHNGVCFLNSCETLTCREEQTDSILDEIDEYRRNWLLHLQRMPQNWIPLKSFHYSLQGKNNWETEEMMERGIRERCWRRCLGLAWRQRRRVGRITLWASRFMFVHKNY
jgi:hypothetical protein